MFYHYAQGARGVRSISNLHVISHSERRKALLALKFLTRISQSIFMETNGANNFQTSFLISLSLVINQSGTFELLIQQSAHFITQIWNSVIGATVRSPLAVRGAPTDSICLQDAPRGLWPSYSFSVTFFLPQCARAFYYAMSDHKTVKKKPRKVKGEMSPHCGRRTVLRSTRLL